MEMVEKCIKRFNPGGGKIRDIFTGTFSGTVQANHLIHKLSIRLLSENGKYGRASALIARKITQKTLNRSGPWFTSIRFNTLKSELVDTRAGQIRFNMLQYFQTGKVEYPWGPRSQRKDWPRRRRFKSGLPDQGIAGGTGPISC